jgi:serine/threonine-protein kinase RsbW
MATVEVSFTPLPAHVRTARLVATAVARRSGVDEALLDEVRLAVGEACSRAVEAHRRHCPAEPVKIEMTDLGERFVVVVSDSAAAAGRPAGAGAPAPAEDHAAGRPGAAAGGPGAASGAGGDQGAFPPGFGLAVISGLADEVRVVSTGSGLSVQMSWPSVLDRTGGAGAAGAGGETAPARPSGEPAARPPRSSP